LTANDAALAKHEVNERRLKAAIVIARFAPTVKEENDHEKVSEKDNDKKQIFHKEDFSICGTCRATERIKK